MLTSFGKLVRKIRIEKEVNLKEMALLIDKSSAFLSAVETGRKNVPTGMVEDIIKKMELTQEEAEQLTIAAQESRHEVSIPMQDFNNRQREVVAAFARHFSSLEPEELTQVQNILGRQANK